MYNSLKNKGISWGLTSRICKRKERDGEFNHLSRSPSIGYAWSAGGASSAGGAGLPAKRLTNTLVSS